MEISDAWQEIRRTNPVCLPPGLDSYVSLLTVCAVARRRQASTRCLMTCDRLTESHMYIGGGILGTILLILLIVYFVRRV
jgi:hypothetical protein